MTESEEKLDKPQAVYFKITTHWGTSLYFDEGQDSLRHGEIGLVPENVTAIISGDQIFLYYRLTPKLTRPDNEVFKLVRDKADIAFCRDNLFACAEVDGRVTFSRRIASDWEHFLPVPMSISSPVRRDSELVSYKETQHSRTRRAIGLYWWRRESIVNLGDEISPRIVSAVSGRNVIFSPIEKADLLAVGSILNTACDRDGQIPTYVWGSGVMSHWERGAEQYIYSAVRGPLTQSCISRQHHIPMGDPGLLTSRVWRGGKSKRHGWGIVPHHSGTSMELFESLRDNTPNSILIDLTNPDIDQTIKAISECYFIASNSLHGLIIADSYGIPNAWIKTPSIHSRSDFKFLDYFCSIARPNQKYDLCKGVNLQSLETLIPPLQYLQNISDVQDTLIKSFPEIS